MKRKLLFAAIVVGCGLTLNSCNKVADQIIQNLTWDGVDVTVEVPPTTAVGSYATIGTGTVIYNLDSSIKAQTGGTMGLKNIKEFKFKSCKLTILNPETDNSFADFSDAKASFSTTTNPTKTLLGEVNNNPDTYADILNLPINTTTNMKGYVPESGQVTINYDLSGSMRRVRLKVTKVQIHVDYTITTQL